MNTTVFLSAGLPTSPAPTVDPETMPFWEAASLDRLVLPYCRACAEYIWYPRGFCPRCAGGELEWRESAGQGHVYSFSIVRRAFGQWAQHAPFVIAYVTLDEGVSTVTNIVDCALEEVTIGLRVEALFEKSSDADSAPCLRFRPSHREIPLPAVSQA
jgi:uncharacterized OB-fold protein